MAVMMENTLTLREFLAVRKNPEGISGTRADLWTLLCLTRTMVTRLIHLKYQDIHDDEIMLPGHGKFAEKPLSPGPAIRKIVVRRRTGFPDDIYLFQSHSNRVKAVARPDDTAALMRRLPPKGVDTVMPEDNRDMPSPV
ncbi:hypothetical protein FPE53_26430 [Salmonella enterica subsp. enterica]|uniref:Integrase n=2 Tax=Salmonella enterica TaxID=28901 RepID=A0A744QJA0_SALER|nr:hypothetical protein [Salmonella enterica subsp. enterica serovar Aqua]ECH1172687.1 hypothetical protein [Salmonella enterica subsp. enterica serovar Aqua]HAF2609517.1 hypothetical protein [Salmonella enterica]